MGECINCVRRCPRFKSGTRVMCVSGSWALSPKPKFNSTTVDFIWITNKYYRPQNDTSFFFLGTGSNWGIFRYGLKLVDIWLWAQTGGYLQGLGSNWGVFAGFGLKLGGICRVWAQTGGYLGLGSNWVIFGFGIKTGEYLGFVCDPNN